MNMLKVVSLTSGGANSVTLKRLKQMYKALILSKLEYGSLLFRNVKLKYVCKNDWNSTQLRLKSQG